MKKIFALILVIFVYSCGYTSIYQEMKKDLNINILDMKGDFELNNYIKNDLKISSNKDSSNIHNLNIETEYNKIILAKDATGKVTDYNIEMSVKFIVVSNNNINISFEENFKIKKNDDNFEQSNYERDIKRNFSKIVQEKLILDLIKLSDN
tara:strand:- start:2489 stop:2941 length:453 start_codon:yes stop_codon:yes gene_type:complete